MRTPDTPHRSIAGLLVALVVAALPAAALAHAGGHVLGTLTAFDAKHLEVKTREGTTVSVPLTDKTRYFVGEAPGAAADLAVGSRVVVHLDTDKTAVEVHLPPKK
jgi:hypothetical protein